MNQLIGYDNNGTVYDEGNFILRKVNHEYFDKIKTIFELYKKFDLKSLGIVETQIDDTSKTLKHKKYPISYPFEWTANMFKDAVLFHLNLFIELDKYGLTLKDSLPNNIVFDDTKPVFVDFLSLVLTEDLKNEKWLVENSKYLDFRFEVLDKMFFPFIFIPFINFFQKKYNTARTMLSERACNCDCVAPNWRDIETKPDDDLNIVITELLKLRNTIDFISFCKLLAEVVEKLDVTPRQSAYASYYEDKKENFDFNDKSDWQNKQSGVANVLDEYKPKTVLDIGANTGWFSRLAEYSGSKVTSVEIDESSVDLLYLFAKQKDLPILPLQIPFENMEKQVFGRTYDDPAYVDRDFKSAAMFLPAFKRLNSDMVLCLALTHHLMLGMGMSIDYVFEILSRLIDKVLVFEFIGLDDNLIKNEPSFFKNLHKFNMENYNIDLIVSKGMQHFKNVKIVDSHPTTRKLIIFEK